MLKRLEIQNYAIIESLTLDLTNGLTIVTGETGAGKSILLGALGLIMGKRADTKVLYDNDKNCVVEAEFNIEGYDLHGLFEELDLDYHDELIIRRVITTSGKSRAFINDEPTTINALQSITAFLVDLHQQFDTLDVNNLAFQTKTIDVLSSNETYVVKYQTDYKDYTKAKRDLEDLEEKNRNSNQEMEFLNFQMSEFNDAELVSGEQEEKEKELEKLTNAEDIQRLGQLTYFQLSEDDRSVSDQLQTVMNELSSLKEVDERIANLYERLTAIREEIRDIAKEGEQIADSTEYDEELIAEYQSRLNLIYRLQKKHNVSSLEDLLELQEGIAKKLEGYNDISTEIDNLKSKISILEKALMDQAKFISDRRKAICPQFEKSIHDMLVPLSMEHAYIKVDMQAMDRLGPNGLDHLQFLFSPNKGSEFKPLKDTASGGEISRLALCIKSLVADTMTLPTLIFDEIDTGVSGEVASRMGSILAALASNHQVISITHSPQIAAKATSHYFVHKSDREDRTVTAIKHLDEAGRIIEIAKMLSGNPPSQAAIANAKELIGG